MDSLSRAKILGGVGSILTLLLFVPYFVGAVLVIIGWILTILAIKDISDTVRDKSIFNNGIVSVVLTIAGTVVLAVVVAAAVLGFVGLGILSPISPPPVSSGIVGLVTGILVGLVAVWVLAIASSFFLWRSYKTIATQLNIKLFSIGALIYLIGAILTIVLVGVVLIFIAQIMFIIAFFSIPTNPTQSPYPQPSLQQPYYPQPEDKPQPATSGAIACPNCGAPIKSGANFCDRCGTRLT
jgi:uncharacterized membrane protein